MLLLEEAFAEHRIPHAFGGALALAYYAVPRTNIDIDVNVFVVLARAEDVLGALETLGAEPIVAEERARLHRDEQVRVTWERTPVDLFFVYDPCTRAPANAAAACPSATPPSTSSLPRT